MRALVIFVLLSSCLVIQAQPTFGPGTLVSRPVIDTPTGVHAADIDGDGDMDVLSASSGDHRIAWYENLGGAFGSRQTITTMAVAARDVAAADLDGDGDMDVLSASEVGIACYWNLGGGAFGPHHVITTVAMTSYRVSTADLDGDGDQDVISSGGSQASQIMWHRNLGGGSFAAESVLATGTRFSVGDIDGDGDPDVMIGETDRAAWAENVGGGSFGPPQNIIVATMPLFDGITDVAIADVDGDGDGDALIAQGIFGAMVGWYENLGPAGFSFAQSLASGGGVGSRIYVVAADLNSDGFQDVLSGFQSLGDWVCPGLGGGAFGAPIAISATPSGDCQPADLDGDGDEDVLYARDDGIAWARNDGVSLAPLQTVVGAAQAVRTVRAADVSGDGKADVLIAAADRIAWYQGSGGGGFSAEQVVTAADQPPTLSAADFDGDGDVDLLFTGIEQSSGWDPVVWAENQGSGTFVFHELGSGFVGPFGRSHLASADLDGDGDQDIVAASAGGNRNFGSLSIWSDPRIFWYENPGGAAFGASQSIVTLAQDPSSLRLVDLDGDDDVDVLFATAEDDRVAWCRNLGGGTFTPPAVITFSANGPSGVDAADLDGDGALEVLVASASDDTLAWYAHLGGGSFGPPQVITTGADGAAAVHAADLDGDGDVDVLSASANDGKLAWFQNLGGGSFAAEEILEMGGDALLTVFAADLDGDGDRDVLAGGTLGVSWYENLIGPRVPVISATQPGGPGAPIFVTNESLWAGHEYYNLFSIDPCPGGPGTGPSPFGGCIVTRENHDFLVAQLSMPLGGNPFHFLAPADSAIWGPFLVPPIVMDAVCFDFTGGVLGPASAVIRINVF